MASVPDDDTLRTSLNSFITAAKIKQNYLSFRVNIYLLTDDYEYVLRKLKQLGSS